MRKQLFSWAAAALSVVALSTEAQAQYSALSLIGGARFGITAPASLAGSRNVTYAQSASGWGTVNFTPPIVNIPIIQAIGTGNGNTDSLLCTPAANGTGGIPSLTGNVAIFYRGSCNFSAKAYEAQLAGAVGAIVIDTSNNPLIGMAAGTNGAQVTIPMFMLSKADGAALMNAIRVGTTVTVSMGLWNLGYANDVGIVKGTSAALHAGALPKNQLGTGNNNPHAYRFFNGSIAANYGTDTVKNLKTVTTVNWMPTGGTSTQVWADTGMLSSLAPQDSVDLPFSGGSFNPHASTSGWFTATSALQPSVMDATVQDNSETRSLYVSDSIYCKGEWDSAAHHPKYQIAWGYSNLSVPLTWGPLFYTALGGQYPEKLQFSLSTGVAGQSLDGSTATTCAFKWNDGSNGQLRDQVIQAEELVLVGVGYKTFTSTDSSFDDFIVPFDPSATGSAIPALQDTSWYYYTVTPSVSTYYYVSEGSTNDIARIFPANRIDSTKREYTTVQYNADVFNLISGQGVSSAFHMIGSYTNPSISPDSLSILVPIRSFNVALHVAPQPAATKNVLGAAINKFDIFPNPSTGLVNVAYDFKQNVGKSQITIFDGTGKAVALKSFEGTTGQISFELSNLATGSYWLVLGNNLGAKAYQFQIIK